MRSDPYVTLSLNIQMLIKFINKQFFSIYVSIAQFRVQELAQAEDVAVFGACTSALFQHR